MTCGIMGIPCGFTCSHETHMWDVSGTCGPCVAHVGHICPHRHTCGPHSITLAHIIPHVAHTAAENFPWGHMISHVRSHVRSCDPTCEFRVKLEQHTNHTWYHMWNTCVHMCLTCVPHVSFVWFFRKGRQPRSAPDWHPRRTEIRTCRSGAESISHRIIKF